MALLTNQKGVTLIAAVATLVILSLMGVVLVSLVGTQTHSTLHQGQSSQAFYLAEAGAQRALTYLSSEGGDCASTSFPNVPLGPGTFTVTATAYHPTPTTLNGGIGAGDTTIPVVSTAGYAPRGRITIEAEEIDYTGTTGTTFTGARRGANNTIAANHGNNKPVSQNQCTVTSTGVLPNATVGDARGVVEVAISSPDWATVASPTTQNLNAVSMVSATDGWAVGNHG
ncbi:MAG: hypothetical protein ACE5HK_01130, partial [Candidatus Methylomirabilales bacterium]